MKFIFILTLALCLGNISSAQQNQDVNYQQYFTGETMRVDYFHTGTATEEHFSI
ncbi:MAG: hypothetical protein HGA37_17760, partial [Lentimicrobium sp.]|nr:hypothetical protein [Lentimicrobium sp.]